MAKDNKIVCDNCGIEFAVKHKTKEAVQFCPFCGEEVAVISDDDENWNDFEFEDE